MDVHGPRMDQTNGESHMFVLRNACRTLRRHPWRSLLTVLVGLLLAAWSVFGTAVLNTCRTALGADYDSIAPQVTIRPSAETLKERAGDDADWTKHYVSWETYNEIGLAAQQANVQFQYSVTTSVPVREDSSFKAITDDHTSDASQDKTGGDFTLVGVFNDVAAQANEMGTWKIVEGENLSYDDVSEPTAIISKQLADANGTKVGDKITVAKPTVAKATCTFKVTGIYEYVTNPNDAPGTDAEFAKDDRDNALYTTYYDFAGYGLDSTDAKGWAIPDVNVIFTLNSPADFEKFKAAIKDVLPEGDTVTSPNLDAYLKSLVPLERLAELTRIILICAWAIGGAILLALTLWQVLPRSSEIGYDLAIGVTRPRVARQFSLESLFLTVPALAIGLLIGAFATNPLVGMLGAGHDIAMDAGVVWKVAWIGLLCCLALAIVAIVRVACYRTAHMLRSHYLNNAD